LEKIKNEKFELEKNLSTIQEDNKHLNENINNLKNHNVELEKRLSVSVDQGNEHLDKTKNEKFEIEKITKR